jgi:hypothetical protein
LLEFIDASQIPLLTINLLQALPQTPLWDRLKRENRLIEDEGRESNVDFRLPYDDVVRMWRACMNDAYQPGKLLERYEYQIRETYPHRITPPPSRAEVMAKYQARPDPASQRLLEGRGPRRLQARILEIRSSASGPRRDRISDRFDSGGPPFDPVRARCFRRAAERVELLDSAARGVCPCRVTPPLKNARAVGPFARRPAGFDPAAGRANPHGQSEI